LFQLLDAAHTGIEFQNTITPNGDFNLLDFEYLYNGGGVGVGDFDNNGLPDLVFTGNMVASKIYLNKGDLQFEDITESTLVNTTEKWCTGVTIIDINNDGFDDIYFCVGGPGKQSVFPNLLYINQGDLTFKEAAVAYGLADANESNHAVFFDYDLDGDLDMYLLNGGGFEKSAVTIRPILKNGTGRNTDKLYQNNFDDQSGHPVFTDVSSQAGITIEGFGLGVGILDANQDAWPDIYVSNDYLSRDLLYINNQDGTFAEKAELYFDHLSHFSMGNDIGDINNDGILDLLTLDMLPESHFRRKMMFGPNQYDRFYQALRYGYGHQYMRNMLHVGDGNARFQEIGQYAGVDQTDWSWCPLIADFDNDGWQDIYITNGYGKDITDLDFVKFRKDAITPFSKPEEVRKLLIESLDDRPSITLPNYAYKNEGNFNFQKVIEQWGFDQSTISTGAAYADLDQDGDLEIIVNNIDQKAFVYKNNQIEKDSTNTHYLQIKLEGNAGNSTALGASLRLFMGDKQQVRYQQSVRGYQGTVSDILHFGLGAQESVDSLEVIWPDGKRSILTNITADQLITIDYQEAQTRKPVLNVSNTLLKRRDKIAHVQEEPEGVNDFKKQPLLVHGFTNQGPGMAVGDVNNDGLEDLIIGGAYGNPAKLYLQNKNESFKEHTLSTEAYEDLGMLLFDVDSDQDLDIYICSGGSERYADHENYQDRIYLNDGKGNYSLDTNALPTMLSSTATVAGADYDQDGDIDLFVGGRVIPGRFPESPKSYLLENTGGKFIDATHKVCAELDRIGMLTSAIWTDFNNDHLQDLIVVGEMMKISVFENDGKQLNNITETAGLSNSTGMWNSIASGDFDQDGDIDYIVGNLGENTPYNIRPEHPLKLHFSDFDENGSVDPIFSIFEEEAYRPLAPLDVLTQQLPELKKKVLKYEAYARSTTEDILDLLDASSMQTLSCEHQASMLLENLGDSQFSMRKLPLQAQMAPVKGILIEDVNLDGLPDAMLVGNDYNMEVIAGNYDASRGIILLNKGSLNFGALNANESGLYARGDARSVVKLKLSEGQLMMVVAKNSGQCDNYIFATANEGLVLDFQEDEISAVLNYSNGKTGKMEYNMGSAYLSQQSRSFRLGPQVQEIHFINNKGDKTRSIDLAEKLEKI
jgi:hypothetical protein